ncbi:MAG: bifunctional folylpolyglutamate synthase/dihydrofolate synthase [Brotaphodocola sp.]
MEGQARRYLDQIPFWTRKKNTLDSVRDFLQEMGNPQNHLNIIHVAGTNGKGSVCADLTAILKEAGYQVGTFISPHLEDVKERFQINGELVPETLFEAGFLHVKTIVDQMMERGYCHPTFFEFVFLMAMDMYGTIRPDYVIMETGLGGRLDTTNAILHPIACVITSISLDHTAYLGDTISQIASEKAGIIKSGVPVVFDDNQPEASEVIRKKAKEMQSDCYPVCDRERYTEAAFTAAYQEMNAALAVKLLDVLKIPGVDKNVCRDGLLKVRWPGRMEQVSDGIWMDGAHNPGGIEAFIRAVKEHGNSENLQLLFAAVSDKDYQEMIHMLCSELSPKRVTVAHMASERGLDTETLKQQFQEFGCQNVEAFGTVKGALHAALQHKTEQDWLYIVGSLYLIGEIKKLLREMR